MSYGHGVGIVGAFNAPQLPYASLAIQSEPPTKTKHSVWTITSIALGALLTLAAVWTGNTIALGIGIACIIGGTWASIRRQISVGSCIYPFYNLSTTIFQNIIPSTQDHGLTNAPIYDPDDVPLTQTQAQGHSSLTYSSQPYPGVMKSESSKSAQPEIDAALPTETFQADLLPISSLSDGVQEEEFSNQRVQGDEHEIAHLLIHGKARTIGSTREKQDVRLLLEATAVSNGRVPVGES